MLDPKSFILHNQARGGNDGNEESYVPASIESMPEDDSMLTPLCLNLDNPNADDCVVGVEMLLSALESCGVDNARYEVPLK